jgi:hypothetical protein
VFEDVIRSSVGCQVIYPIWRMWLTDTANVISGNAGLNSYIAVGSQMPAMESKTWIRVGLPCQFLTDVPGCTTNSLSITLHG